MFNVLLVKFCAPQNAMHIRRLRHESTRVLKSETGNCMPKITCALYWLKSPEKVLRPKKCNPHRWTRRKEVVKYRNWTVKRDFSQFRKLLRVLEHPASIAQNIMQTLQCHEIYLVADSKASGLLWTRSHIDSLALGFKSLQPLLMTSHEPIRNTL